MATVTGYTAERMKQIEDKAVVDGEVQGDNLILFQHDGTNIDAGNVRGPKGDRGPTGEVSEAELAAVTGPSANAGNDLTNGSDGKLFFDHDNKYKDHIPKFADNAQRDAAITAPVLGQMCCVAGVIQKYAPPGFWIAQGSRFSAWNTASQSIGVDGFVDLAYNGKDDPYGMMSTANTFKVPVTGVYHLLVSCITSASGAATNFISEVSLFVDGVEAKKGPQFTVATNSVSQIGCSVMAIMALNKDQLVLPRVYASAPGCTKAVAGGKSLNYFEGVYLG